jgi:POT family proton-dependent oligopeptide transporter
VASVATATRTDWFGQPRGLTILFLTEMWDQFSFFGMRALLVLYMTKQLAIGQAQASWIYGGYAALVYLTPVFGGVITDRWLRRRTAVIVGGTIMAAGHFMMASESLLLAALATIALGNGLFLPSLPSQIDSLYAPDDPRRKSAYNLYYVGVNLGALMAPLVVGTVGEAYGFHWGFALAGFGMIVALTTYISGARYLPPDPPPQVARRTRAMTAPQPSHREFRQRAALLLAIVGAVIVFRGAYEQLGNTLSLWADQSVDRTITATFSIPVTWFQSLNPLTVFALTPVFVARWTRMAAQNKEPPSVLKMVIGALVIAISYLAIAALAFWAQREGKQVSWEWLASFMVVMTAGELYILPVGLGLFGRLAPAGFTATSIAGWFFAGFLGNIFAGWLGTLWTPLTHGVFFALIGAVALTAAGLLSLSIRKVTRAERSS